MVEMPRWQILSKVGDWKNYLNEESTVKIWDEWIPENLQGTDIVLPES